MSSLVESPTEGGNSSFQFEQLFSKLRHSLLIDVLIQQETYFYRKINALVSQCVKVRVCRQRCSGHPSQPAQTQ
ncbi:MAG: hypothetical protein QOF09_3453 [Alphaproteobacteria bacterium]|jgi:hypothetical protein|nr:hypothetical protein [Alphaproteobacteria bacterium]